MRVEKTLLIAAIIGLMGSIGAALPSEAASVRIEGESPGDELTVEVRSANVEAVLDTLGKKFGFDFVGPSGGAASPVWTATLRGDLDRIVSRLLRNHNHSIVRSMSSPRRIERIILIDRTAGSRLVPASRLDAAGGRPRRPPPVLNPPAPIAPPAQ